MCVCVYICIYIQTHTHTCTHSFAKLLDANYAVGLAVSPQPPQRLVTRYADMHRLTLLPSAPSTSLTPSLHSSPSPPLVHFFLNSPADAAPTGQTLTHTCIGECRRMLRYSQICIHVCIRIYMYVCVDVYMSICMYVMSICMYMYISI